jgi:hypothetical protein
LIQNSITDAKNVDQLLYFINYEEEPNEWTSNFKIQFMTILSKNRQSSPYITLVMTC